MVDYSTFRLKKLDSPEFRHLKYLLYWPVFGLAFFILERLWIRKSYHPVYCPLDDLIPFCEYFLIPYLFWFLFLLFIHVYTLLFDTASFVKLMKFIMVSYSLALAVFILFPNCQELRPETFERDNPFTRFIAGFYRFDTNTNVSPSLHVIGSVAVAVCAWHSRHFSAAPWRLAFCAAAFLISVSTVFLKQHSILDILAAIPVCAVAYVYAYSPPKRALSPQDGRKKRPPGQPIKM